MTTEANDPPIDRCPNLFTGKGFCCLERGHDGPCDYANDTPTNATEGRMEKRVGFWFGVGSLEYSRIILDARKIDAEITDQRAQLNRVIESSSIAESGRLNAEAEVLRLREALEKIAADEDPYYSPEAQACRMQLNPYRCPECDGNLERYEATARRPYPAGTREGYKGVGFHCPTHGDLQPKYDDRRRCACVGKNHGSFGGDSDCGCDYDSGPYRQPCKEHDPISIAEAALAQSILKDAPKE